MTKLERKLKSNLRRLGLGDDDAIIIGVSGGGDSVSLLDALVRKRDYDKASSQSIRRVVVAHLNHKLRGDESDEDENFVRELAAHYNVEFCSSRSPVSDIAKSEKRNLEETARLLRYEFFRKVAQELNIYYVLTAHTLDDQTETILMRLIRGTGPSGIQGIYETSIAPSSNQREINDYNHIKLVRPILNVTKDEVLDHCRHYEVSFRTDSSNLSPDFTRNRIRQELVPLLRSFNPRFDEALLRNAEMQKEDDEYIQQISTILFSDVTNLDKLDISEICQAHSSLRRRAIREWLNNQSIRYDASHVYAVDHLITHNRSGRYLELPGREIIRRQFNTLIREPINKDRASEALPESVLLLENNLCRFGAYIFRLHRKVSLEKISSLKQIESAGRASIVLLRESSDLDNLNIRVRKSGDQYVPAGSKSGKKLKTMMIRHRIGIMERDKYPVIVTKDDRIVFVPGLPVADEFVPGDGLEIGVIEILF